MPEIENQNLELKREVENFKEISKTACAFANAFGGKIIIGIDNSGIVFGVPEKNLDNLQQRIEGAIQQTSPAPLHKISIEEREGKKIVVAEIYRIGQGAFCTFGGIVYYRSGSMNSKLEGRTLQDFLVRSRILSFDDSLSDAKLEDMDATKVSNFLKKRSPNVAFEEGKLADYLINLGVAQKSAELAIKNVAILFFAKEPKRFLPQNEMKLVRFKGSEAIEIIDSRFVNSTVLENLKEAEEFIKKNTSVAFRIEGLARKEVPEYPESAMREALVNSVLHRDYFSKDSIQINIFDNRIEFINPGTLPSGLTMQILGSLSVQRNPTIYQLMRELGFVEGLATGIPRMRSEMRVAGLPEPKFEELGNFFRVILYNKTIAEERELNERQKRALDYLERNPSISSKKYIELGHISHPIAVAELNRLCLKGLVKRIGRTRGAYYVKGG
ncbi:MAG: ATP-binding protein [Candidatus Micrarchaeota archaeon]